MRPLEAGPIVASSAGRRVTATSTLASGIRIPGVPETAEERYREHHQGQQPDADGDPNNCIWVGNCGSELTLAVPRGQGVNASAGSGNVSANDLASPLVLYSGSGNVSIADVSGSLDLTAGSGDITGTDVSATTVRASDGSGDVDLSFKRVPDQVRVSASSGDITVALPGDVSYAVSASTNNGAPDIGVPTSSSSRHVIDLTAGSGDINVIPAGP